MLASRQVVRHCRSLWRDGLEVSNLKAPAVKANQARGRDRPGLGERKLGRGGQHAA